MRQSHLVARPTACGAVVLTADHSSGAGPGERRATRALGAQLTSGQAMRDLCQRAACVAVDLVVVVVGGVVRQMRLEMRART